MGNWTNYAENKLLDHVLGEGGETYARPTHLYCALCTADPGEAAIGSGITEVSGGSYTRIVCDDWDSASSRAAANSAAITFPEASASLGTITHFAILDTVTAATGNVIAYGVISPNKAPGSGDTIYIDTGDIDVSFDSGEISTYLANKLIDHVFEGTPYSQPDIFVALCTATPVDADTGSTISEPADNYARISDDAWGTAASGATDNDGAITFTEATNEWATVTHFALCDHISTGQVLFFGGLNTSKLIGAGDTARFAAGELDVTLD